MKKLLSFSSGFVSTGASWESCSIGVLTGTGDERHDGSSLEGFLLDILAIQNGTADADGGGCGDVEDRL